MLKPSRCPPVGSFLLTTRRRHPEPLTYEETRQFHIRLWCYAVVIGAYFALRFLSEVYL